VNLTQRFFFVVSFEQNLREVLKKNPIFKKSQVSDEEDTSLSAALANWNFADKSDSGFVGLSNQGHFLT
jgi:hypothetical protein